MASGILEPGDGLGTHPAIATAHDAFRIGFYVRQIVMLHANATLPKLFDSFLNIVHYEIENCMLGRMIVG